MVQDGKAGGSRPALIFHFKAGGHYMMTYKVGFGQMPPDADGWSTVRYAVRIQGRDYASICRQAVALRMVVGLDIADMWKVAAGRT